MFVLIYLHNIFCQRFYRTDIELEIVNRYRYKSPLVTGERYRPLFINKL